MHVRTGRGAHARREGPGHERACHYNLAVQVRASAPTRLDLAGGTLDIWPLYLFHDDAQTINAALAIRAECEVRPRTDGRWQLRSEDTGKELTLESPAGAGPAEHRLALQLLRFFRPDPATIVTRSGSPVGAGLAGSSALNIALCGALTRYTGRTYAPEELIDIALHLETQIIGVPTGAQDYRPAMYGGVAAIEMGPDGITRRPLAVLPADLEARITLAYTGQSRDSSVNNWEIMKRHIDGDARVVGLLEEIAAVARALREALEAGDWPAVGEQLRREWSLRKQLAPGVTTPAIERLVSLTRDAGAAAAKVCGAGGGGCVLVLAEPETLPAVRNAVVEAGAAILDAQLDRVGLRVTVTEADE